MKLILSSENFSEKPYIFSLTNIKVYSIEEALWHIFNYLRESLEIFEDNAFFEWLRDGLGLTKELDILNNANIKDNDEKLIDFLSQFEYLNKDEIEDIKKRLYSFANIGNFEKQKEIGDKLYKAKKYQQAVDAYSKALEMDLSKEYIIKNNIGLCCMQCGDYESAVAFFEQAYEKNNNSVIMLNLAEGYILCSYTEKAEELLSLYKGEDLFRVTYLKGMIALGKGEYNNSVEILKSAVDIKEDVSLILKISDIFIKQRRFDDAVNFLNEYNIIDAEIYIRLSEIYCAQRNYSAAIKITQRGLIHFRDSIELWIMLAKCYRLDLDFVKADGAVCKALSLNNDSEEANLELARLRKSQGKTSLYQSSINNCLNIIKNKYLSDVEIDEK